MLAAAALALSACPHGKPKPVEIVLSEDSCNECRMAVSDKKFAAEIVTPEGHVDYFDDIGCLVVHARAKDIPVGSAVYVVDFNDQRWLDGLTAQYLWAKSLPTPMSYGLAAFASKDAATLKSHDWPGRVLGWQALLQDFQP
jgi:copper chaperone NosL